MNERAYIDIVDHCYEVVDQGGDLQALTRHLGTALGADAGDIVTEDRSRGAIQTHGSFGFDPGFPAQL